MKECVSIEAENPSDEHDLKLVHVHGVTNNANELCDEVFAVAV
jgi:hypothetical protein